MDIRKVTVVGNSIGVTLPAEVARAYGLERGALVSVEPTKDGILLRPVKVVSALEPEGVALSEKIIQRYRRALDAMAKDQKKVSRR